MKRLIWIAIGLALSGCVTTSDQDRVAITKFSVNPDRTFVYTTDAVFRDGEDFNTAPISRAAWLDDWLRQNNLCPGNYEIIDRQRVRTHGSLSGGVYQATYTGRCLQVSRSAGAPI